MADKSTLSVKNFGLAVGTTWGLGALIIGILAWQFNYGNEIVDLCATVYKGYGASLKGSVVGGVEGFIDGFIGGAIVAWFYNHFQNK